MHAAAALVASLTLPFGVNWSTVEPAGAKLLVSGFAERGPSCVFLSVDPASLASRRTDSRCVDPTRRVAPVELFNPHSQWRGVRVAGRIVLWFNDASDTKPVWAYGPGMLWLYDVATTRGPLLLRFSSTTGRLEETIPMPQLYRPLVAANADGAWLVADTSGGVSGQYPAALYHVRPGSGRPVVVHREGRAALWIVGHGHSVWVDLISGQSTVALWRFDGTAAKAHRLKLRTHVTVGEAVYGRGALWGVTFGNRGCTLERAVRIDPNTGRETAIATVPPLDTCLGLGGWPNGLTFFRGALWFLDLPRLYRVRAP